MILSSQQSTLPLPYSYQITMIVHDKFLNGGSCYQAFNDVLRDGRRAIFKSCATGIPLGFLLEMAK